MAILKYSFVKSNICSHLKTVYVAFFPLYWSGILVSLLILYFFLTGPYKQYVITTLDTNSPTIFSGSFYCCCLLSYLWFCEYIFVKSISPMIWIFCFHFLQHVTPGVCTVTSVFHKDECLCGPSWLFIFLIYLLRWFFIRN